MTINVDLQYSSNLPNLPTSAKPVFISFSIPKVPGQLDLFQEIHSTSKPLSPRSLFPASSADLSKPHKLHLVPKPILFEGEEFDPESQATPSARSELPDVTEWVSKYLHTVIEIWGGKRSAAQLARWTHKSIYPALQRDSGKMKKLPKIRRIYISEPIEGVAETTTTLRFDERVRSMIMRFEGVDQRWLCTEMKII